MNVLIGEDIHIPRNYGSA